MNAVEIYEKANRDLASGEITLVEYRKRIAPITDVETVIRCKDCKYNSNSPEYGNADCVLFYGMTDQMGFCHHGERREQDDGKT